jgi:hypothetical protein
MHYIWLRAHVHSDDFPRPSAFPDPNSRFGTRVQRGADKENSHSGVFAVIGRAICFSLAILPPLGNGISKKFRPPICFAGCLTVYRSREIDSRFIRVDESHLPASAIRR